MSEVKKILFAYDGSESADAALDDLSRAGFPANAVTALVVSVADVWLPPLGTDESAPPKFMTPGLKRKYENNLKLVETAGTKASEAAERMKRSFPGWDVSSEHTYGSPAWEILGIAEEFHPDVIVVGAKGSSAVERVLLGSVSSKIVAEAKCQVRVARGKVITDDSPIRIVVGYDGTEGSRHAVRSVSGRDWPAATEARVVIVEDSMFVRSSLEIEIDEIEKVGGELVDDLNRIGLRAELSVVEGNAKDEIPLQAERWGADCIFIGATRYDDIITRYLLGSVSSAIVSRAHCSVEVVRPASYGTEAEQ